MKFLQIPVKNNLGIEYISPANIACLSISLEDINFTDIQLLSRNTVTVGMRLGDVLDLVPIDIKWD